MLPAQPQSMAWMEAPFRQESQVRLQDLDELKHDSSDLTVDDATAPCRLYTRLLPFAQKPDTSACDKPSRHDADVEKIVQEINELLPLFQSTKRKLEEKCKALEIATLAVVEATFDSPDAYRGGNILCKPLGVPDPTFSRIHPNCRLSPKACCYRDIEELLQRSQISDIDHFAAYIYRILPEAVREHSTGREWMPCPVGNSKGRWFNASPIVYKVFLLVERLIVSERSKEALHTLVLLKALLHDGDKLVERHWVKFTHPTIDRAVHELVEDTHSCRRHNGETNATQTHSNKHTEVRSEVSAAGLTWQSLGGACSIWDFACAARTLRATYLALNCMLVKNVNDEPRCFRHSNVDLLGWLLQKAWSEIRAKIFQTIGTVFSVELTELIFERALDAEEVPLQPNIDERVVTDQEPAEVERRRKDEYRCIATVLAGRGNPNASTIMLVTSTR